MGIDRRVFLWINHWPETLSPFLRFFSVSFNYPWMKILLGLLVIGMLVRGPRCRRGVLLALISTGLANSLTDVFKHMIPMHRPFQPEELGHLVHLRVGYASTMGTASGHAANMMAVATALTLVLGRWGWPWIAIALITGLSRVYVGAHYPWQVLLGYACGFTTANLVVLVANVGAERFEERKARRAQKDKAKPTIQVETESRTDEETPIAQ